MNKKRVIFDIETTGLDAFQSRVTCVSIMNVETKVIESCCEQDEKHILQWCMRIFRLADEIVGFNTEGFDIEFLIKRCLIKRVPVFIPDSLDLRLVLGRGNKFSKGTMRVISSQMGFEAKTHSGLEVIKLFEEGKLDEVKRHCEEDVLMSYWLYVRMCEVNLI